MNKKRDILIYADNDKTFHTELTVQIDNNGDAWLTPGQIDFLESAHVWAKNEYILPDPAVSLVKSSDVGNGLLFSGASV
jgi:hypothetical protein